MESTVPPIYHSLIPPTPLTRPLLRPARHPHFNTNHRPIIYPRTPELWFPRPKDGRGDGGEALLHGCGSVGVGLGRKGHAD